MPGAEDVRGPSPGWLVAVWKLQGARARTAWKVLVSVAGEEVKPSLPISVSTTIPR